MSEHITVAGDKPTIVYAFRGPTNDDGSPVSAVPGVPARDLTEFDLAAMDAGQRLQVHLLSQREGGAYKKVGKVPAGLSMAPGDDDSDEEAPVIPDEARAEFDAPEEHARFRQTAAAKSGGKEK